MVASPRALRARAATTPRAEPLTLPAAPVGAPTAVAEVPEELEEPEEPKAQPALEAKALSAAPAARQVRPCQAQVDREASRQLVLGARPARPAPAAA
jgi:hypothetical protein